MPTANLARLLRWNVVRRAEREALVDGDERWTYAELDAAVDLHAAALVQVGVRAGEIVAVLGRNSATYVIEMFAIARVGAVHLPLNWRLHERELALVLGHAGASTLLVDEESRQGRGPRRHGNLVRFISHAGRACGLADVAGPPRRGPADAGP